MKKVFLIFTVMVSILVVFDSCKVSKKQKTPTPKSNYMNSVYQALKDSFPNTEVYTIMDSVKITFPDDIVFGFGSTKINEIFYQKLRTFTNILNKFEKTNLLVTGHTDNVGEAETNVTLSTLRAEAVKSQLVLNQVNSKRIFIWGLGDKQPRESNKTEEGRAKNRRVEFVVLYNE